jgi:hypothetical protein
LQCQFLQTAPLSLIKAYELLDAALGASAGISLLKNAVPGATLAGAQSVESKPGPFLSRAMVHHDPQARVPRTFPSGLVNNAQLHPNGLRTYGYRFIRDRARESRINEQVDHIDGNWNVRKTAVYRFTEYLLTSETRIDGDATEAFILQKFHDPIRCA